MGRAFFRGLQGNDPNYLKAAACAKHFAVHSGPETTRHHFNALPSETDFRETYLPAFKTLVGFRRIHLPPGESKDIIMGIDLTDMYQWDNQNQRYYRDEGTYFLEMKPYNENGNLIRINME